jgi:hypothetical protein
MMRRLFPALAGLSVAVGVAVLGRPFTFGRQDPVLPPPRLAPSSGCELVPFADPALQLQGVASCAAAACHHGNDRPETRGSEYSTWVGKDPHARAYAVLFDKRSLDIGKHLKLDKAPHEDATCLNCHVQPDVSKQPQGPRFAVQEGVGCESCHGPAQKWLARHYLNEWRAMDTQQKANEGMTDTKDLVVRARVCAACHVGRGEGDVNHDLIAAGHPQMRYEYGAYLANYPRHWSREKDRGGRRDFEARVWLIGQVASARAAVELLEYRASRPDRPWPEFAEYGCFGCHHDLRDERWRRPRNGRAPGSLAWGQWYMSLLPILAKRGGVNLQPITTLERVMEKTFPTREEALPPAQAACGALDSWLKGVTKKPLGESSVESLLAALVRDDKLAESGWDSATQLYLGVAALYQSLMQTDPGSWRGTGVGPVIRSMERRLDDAFPNPANARYESPGRFSPKGIQAEVSELRKLLKIP